MVGAEVGVIEGARVGGVGASVGKVGVNVGCAVGTVEGCPVVGEEEGAAEGGVGASEGDFVVGALVGVCEAIVGVIVGFNVKPGCVGAIEGA